MKPLQEIARVAKEWHWDPATLHHKRTALSNAYSHAAFQDPQTLAVFAHGDELVRARQRGDRASVESYNVHVEGWDVRTVGLFEWEAVQAAAWRYTHAEGRMARVFVALPLWVSPEPATGLSVTPLYPRCALRPQGYGVFEQIDDQLHLIAAYHRGYEDRARLLACELLVEDERSPAMVQKAIDAAVSATDPKDWRRITPEDLAIMTKANAAPRGTKFPQAFEHSGTRADPAYLPSYGAEPAWGVQDFLDYAATPPFAALVSLTDRTTGVGPVAATAATARAIFDYAGPLSEPGDEFDHDGFAVFYADHFTRRMPEPSMPRQPATAGQNSPSP